MINAEKFKKEILAMMDKNDRFAIDNKNVFRKCVDLKCSECLFGEGLCYFERMKWLLSEHKEPIKVSKLEYDILKYLFNDTGYRYIVRDKYYHEGDIFYLYIFKNRPREDSGGWHSNDPYDRSQFYAFNNLFKFIKFEDEKPTLIQSILENCEVADND
mgnify:CR=1 FL=1